MLANTLMVIALMASGLKVPQDIDIKSRIEVAAVQNQIDPEKMLALCNCESKFSTTAWNKDDPGEYGSRGIFQYQNSTFYNAAKQYGLKNPDIWNYDHQIKITAFLLAQNKWELWYNCSKKIGMIK